MTCGVQVKHPKRAIEDATAVIEAVEGGAVHDAKQQKKLRCRALYRCVSPVCPHHVHRGRNRERSNGLQDRRTVKYAMLFRPCKSQACRCVWLQPERMALSSKSAV